MAKIAKHHVERLYENNRWYEDALREKEAQQRDDQDASPELLVAIHAVWAYARRNGALLWEADKIANTTIKTMINEVMVNHEQK